MIAYLETHRAKKFEVYCGLDPNTKNEDGIRCEVITFDRLVLKMTREQAFRLGKELLAAAELEPLTPKIPREKWDRRPTFTPADLRGPALSKVRPGTEVTDDEEG